MMQAIADAASILPISQCSENTVLQHPYRAVYSRLDSLRSAPKEDQRRLCRNLAKEAGLSMKTQVDMELLMTLPWFESVMVEEIFYLALRERYAYGMLDTKVLEKICRYSPIVYMAAGNGYNAWLLEQLGATVLAMDAFPVEEGSNWFFNTKFGLPSKEGRSWTKIRKGDSASLKGLEKHTLLLCWPPKNSMAAQCLSSYSGKTIIFLGNKKTCANSAFFSELEKNWKALYSVKTGVWKKLHTEWFEIYERR